VCFILGMVKLFLILRGVMQLGIFRTNFARSRYFYLHGCKFRNICPISHEVSARQMHTFLAPPMENCIFHCKCRALDVEHVYLNFAPWLRTLDPLCRTPHFPSPGFTAGVQFRYPLGAVMHRHRMPSMLMAIIICMPFHQYTRLSMDYSIVLTVELSLLWRY